jgi:hypothetical protein
MAPQRYRLRSKIAADLRSIAFAWSRQYVDLAKTRPVVADRRSASMALQRHRLRSKIVADTSDRSRSRGRGNTST